MVKLDSIDKQLLEILQADSKLNVKEISAILKLTKETCELKKKYMLKTCIKKIKNTHKYI